MYIEDVRVEGPDKQIRQISGINLKVVNWNALPMCKSLVQARTPQTMRLVMTHQRGTLLMNVDITYRVEVISRRQCYLITIDLVCI